MTTKFLIDGWNTPRVQIRRGGGSGVSPENPVYVQVSGNGEPPSPPEDTSRAGVYRWLADLEEQGFVTEFTKFA